MSQLRPLCAATRRDAPDCCEHCVFWQHRSRVVDADVKERWAQGVERTFGHWGRLLEEDGRFRGFIQFGPAGAFPRARDMPAGPPSRDAALITCVFMAGDDLPGLCEHLILEALADLKARRVAAVEAFGLAFSRDVPREARFEEHHTLFDRAFLERFGFRVVRARGQVSLMRLPLGGLQPAMEPGLLARLAQPIRSLSVSSPLPAALREPS